MRGVKRNAVCDVCTFGAQCAKDSPRKTRRRSCSTGKYLFALEFGECVCGECFCANGPHLRAVGATKAFGPGDELAFAKYVCLLIALWNALHGIE